MTSKTFNKEEAQKEIEKLEIRLQLVLEEVARLKEKLANDGKVSAAELDIVVKDLDQLHRIMGERRDVGH